MHAFAHTIIAMERLDSYRREADAWRLGQLARERPAARATARSEPRFDPVLTMRELRRVVLRRLLGEAATA
jgi:hypothetical protein